MSGTGSGGERGGDREVIERHTRELREAGVSPRRAEEMARESMRRVDRKLRDEGRR